MTTLVTGAAGFLGSHVARQLVARGEQVRVLVMRVLPDERVGAHLDLKRFDNRPSNFFLDLKQIRQFAIVSFGPNAVLINGPYQLCRDTKMVA